MIQNTLKDVEMPGYLGPEGSGLSVLVSSEYTFLHHWMAFSAWYSIYKNLPEAKVAIIAPRANDIQNYLYSWVYKSDARYMLHKNVGFLNKLYGIYVALKADLVRQPLLVIDADMMAVEDFTTSMIGVLNNARFVTNPANSIWYFNNQPLEKFEEVINTLQSGEDQALLKVFGSDREVLEELANETHEEGVTSFTHCKEKCGNFSKKDWEKGKKLPPFGIGYALQTAEMTLNERKVISLWNQMASLFETLNQITI